MADDFRATPTLVIGLGGTGLKIATYLKKSLYELNSNRLPAGMALMVIDTEASAQYVLGGGSQERDERNVTGSVRIEGGEYFALSGDVRRLGETIKQEQLAASANPALRSGQALRHINNWFPARYYIDEVGIDAATWNLDRGAGRLRQFGRLGLFNKYSEITRILRENLRAIRQTGANGLYVHIVGSVAGGTGAALFIDFAHLIKQYARSEGFSQTPVIIGHFVLPEGFRGTPGVQISEDGVRADFDARAFAAIRELTRLQGTIPARAGGYPLTYKPDGTGPERARLNENLYSSVYLYDGVRPRNPLNTQKIENGLAPSIADTVMAYIDDRSSAAFTAHTVNNRAFYSAFNIPDGQVTYGTIGTYTIELPIYHLVEGWSHDLARQVLDTLLLPLRRDPTSELPLALTTDHPGEQAGDPQKRAEEWLRTANTALVRQFAEWGKQARKETSPTQEAAIKSVLNLDAGAWLQNLVPTDFEARELTAEAESELQGSLRNRKEGNRYYVNHSGLPGDNAASRGENMRIEVENQMKLMLGRMSNPWQREGGNFGKALTRLGNYHLRRFAQALETTLKETLNGDANQANSLIRKQGKLGYALAMLREVDGLLKGCTGLLVKATQQSESQRKPQFDRLFNELQAAGGKMSQANRFGEGGERGKFRDKADELTQFHKADIARQVAYGLLEQLQTRVERAVSELELWQRTIATSAAADGGTYALLLDGQRNIAADQQTLSNAVRWVISDHETNAYLSSKHDQYTAQAMEELLRLVEWQFGTDKDGRLKIDFALGGATWNRQAGGANQRAMGLRNLTTLLTRCRAVYEPARTDLSVVEYLRTNYEDREPVLAERIFQHSGFPLEPTAPNAKPPMRTTYLRVHKDNLRDRDIAFLRKLRQEVAVNFGDTSRQMADTATGPTASIEGENSHDPFKLSFLLFGDLLRPDEARSVDTARSNYRNRVSQWQQLHILPAESNALKIETQMSSSDLGQSRRELREEVVTVLEDADRFHVAMQCLAYGETDYEWEPGGERGVLLHKYLPPREENPLSWSYWRLTIAPEGALRADGKIYTRYGLAQPTHYQVSELAAEPDLVQALIQFVCRAVDRGDGTDIAWDSVNRTLSLMIERHNQYWQKQAETPWIAAERARRTPQLLHEAHDKAAQIIRLNSYITYLQRQLNAHAWAWRAGVAQPTDGQLTPAKRIATQQFVDLLTALRAAAAEEKRTLEQRFGDLATWRGKVPDQLIDLGAGVTTAPASDSKVPEAQGGVGESPPSTTAGPVSETSQPAIFPPVDLLPGQWQCISCGVINADEDTFCITCSIDRPIAPVKPLEQELTPFSNGARWPLSPLPEQTLVQSSEPERVCENGHPLAPDAEFCSKCGRSARKVALPESERVCENGHPLAPDAEFCSKCGRPARKVAPPEPERVCENGHPLAPDAEFCSKCGSPARHVV